MANYIVNQGRYSLNQGTNLGVQNQVAGLQSAISLIESPQVASLTSTAASGLYKIGDRQVASPRNIGEAIYFFRDEFFGEAPDPYYYTSKYGTPVYNYLLIKGDEPSSSERFSRRRNSSAARTNYTNGKNENGEKLGNPNTWSQLNSNGVIRDSFPAIFIDSALINVSVNKKIIKTNIVNNPNTRKEYIASNDYSINISGVFSTNSDRNYPISDVDALIRACAAPIPLTIVSPILYRFGINRMVVESLDMPQERGVYGTQKFRIKAISHPLPDAEIGMDLANDTQNKGVIKGAIDTVGNLRNTLDEGIENFFKGEPFLG